MMDDIAVSTTLASYIKEATGGWLSQEQAEKLVVIVSDSLRFRPQLLSELGWIPVDIVSEEEGLLHRGMHLWVAPR